MAPCSADLPKREIGLPLVYDLTGTTRQGMPRGKPGDSDKASRVVRRWATESRVAGQGEEPSKGKPRIRERIWADQE